MVIAAAEQGLFFDLQPYHHAAFMQRILNGKVKSVSNCMYLPHGSGNSGFPIPLLFHKVKRNGRYHACKHHSPYKARPTGNTQLIEQNLRMR